MYMMVRLRSAKFLAWLLASVVIVPYLSAGALAQGEIALPQSVVLFPIESDQSAGNVQAAAELSGFLKDGLSANPGYQVVAYSQRLPAVQRLVSLQPDKKSVAEGPFSTDSAAVGRALILAKAMSSDLVVVGLVDKYTFDAAGGTADVTASVRVLDGKTGKYLLNMKEIRGHAAKPSGTESVNEVSLRREAVRDAGRRIVKEMTGAEYQGPVGPVQTPIATAKKSSRKSWVPMLLLSLGVGLLLGGSGGGDSGGTPAAPVDSGTEPPPPPPVL